MNTTRRGFFPALAAIFAGIPAMLGMKAKERPLWQRAWDDVTHDDMQAVAVPGLRRMIRWIPVSERAPVCGPTSGWNEFFGVSDGYVTAVSWVCEDGCEPRWHEPNVTYWAEKPSGPNSEPGCRPIIMPDIDLSEIVTTRHGVVLDGNLRVNAIKSLGDPTEMTW